MASSIERTRRLRLRTLGARSRDSICCQTSIDILGTCDLGMIFFWEDGRLVSSCIDQLNGDEKLEKTDVLAVLAEFLR